MDEARNHVVLIIAYAILLMVTDHRPYDVSEIPQN